MKVNNSILFISDKPEQFRMAVMRFRRDGYRVQFAASLVQSPCFADGETPLLIISELAVPNIDGLELCKRIRRDLNLSATPILLVGDLSKGSSIVSDAMRCGADDYIQKPIDDRELLNACRSIAGLIDKYSTYETWEIAQYLISNN